MNGVCKHGYSVLNELGFNSLSQYITSINRLDRQLNSRSLRNLYPKNNSLDAIYTEARM